MDPTRVVLVVCLTVFIVVIINLVIYFSIAGRKKGGEAGVWSQVLANARNPWKTELLRMEELSQRVAELKSNVPDPDQELNQESQDG